MTRASFGRNHVPSPEEEQFNISGVGGLLRLCWDRRRRRRRASRADVTVTSEGSRSLVEIGHQESPFCPCLWWRPLYLFPETAHDCVISDWNKKEVRTKEIIKWATTWPSIFSSFFCLYIIIINTGLLSYPVDSSCFAPARGSQHFIGISHSNYQFHQRTHGALLIYRHSSCRWPINDGNPHYLSSVNTLCVQRTLQRS